MSIKTTFRLVLAVGAAIVILAALLFGLNQTALIEDTSRGARLDHLADEGTQLVQLTTEVLLYGEPRAMQQWMVVNAQVREAITTAPQDGDADLGRILQALARRFDQLSPLMSQLLDTRAPASRTEVLEIVRSQLFQDATQFQASLRDLKAYSEQLRRTAYARSKERQFLIFASFLGLLAAYVAAASVLFRVTVMAPLAKLEQTIRLQREGRRQRVPVRAADELGTVCQTFNMLLDEQESTRHALEEQAKVLKRANADLESFAWAAAHDLREPLRMVSNYVSMIERHLGPSVDPNLKTFIGYAVEGAKRMYDLIGGLLDYACVDQAEAGFEMLAMDEVMESCLADMSEAIAQAGATVTIQGPLPHLKGGRRQLTQLFENLIDNAIKFHRPGSPPEVVIGCRDEGNGWGLFVQDNGIGIDPAYADKIFTMFQRVAPRGVYEGTGIGLSLCKKIVEFHGGAIRVESHEGQGATFFVSLPKPL
jgi:signal transduction histidine kinase